MLVKELVESLKRHDQEYEINLFHYDEGFKGVNHIARNDLTKNVIIYSKNSIQENQNEI